VSEPIGSCCLVLHSHLPWLPGHGTWPVGEEWLYQAWSQTYLPVVDVLERLAAEGRTDLLTLGVTPVLAAQLDDPYALRQMHAWLGLWQLRAEGLAGHPDPYLRDLAGYEFRRAAAALRAFEDRWRHGGSPVLRALADAGAIELLGGPLTHPFQPLLHDRVARFALAAGLDDHVLRFGKRPDGIWAPECGFRPGLEQLYAAAGVSRFLVDGPTLRAAGRSTGAAWTVAATDVVVFGRDDELTYRVWSPVRGYPAGPDYRDFHTFDHPSGFKPARVTSTDTPPEAKQPYRLDRALAAVTRDATDFVSAVRARLGELHRDTGRPGLVVVACDTELFGHWWHEGPIFLEQVLRDLPDAGIEVTTLRAAVEAGHVAGPAELPAGSWGAGKDFRLWTGDRVTDLIELGNRLQHELVNTVDRELARASGHRRHDLDELARQALLALSSDWAFMVSNDSTPDYARRRAYGHAAAFDRVRQELSCTTAPGTPFPHLDARLLAEPTPGG
jgi:1,4-alpha-glucan branching enzyme